MYITAEDAEGIVGYCDYTTENSKIVFNRRQDGNIKQTDFSAAVFPIVDLKTSDGVIRAICVKDIQEASLLIPTFKTVRL